MNIYDYEDLLAGRLPKEDIRGKTFCFTGKFRYTKDYYERLVVNSQGVVKSSVVKKLDFLVIPNYFYYKTEKYFKAEQQGTKIIKEAEFLSMVQ
jgi:NAD-dependent DNA ligase